MKSRQRPRRRVVLRFQDYDVLEESMTASPDRADPSRRGLVAAAIDGDQAARDQLARRLMIIPDLIEVIDRRRGSRLPLHERQDLAQDTLMRVWQKLDAVTDDETIEKWLYRFCCLEYQNRLRAHRRRAGVSTPLGPLELADEHPPPAPASDHELLESTLTRLGPPEAAIIRLKHYDHLTFPEIAARLDISPNTAKTQYYRGIEWMRRELRTRLMEPTDVE